MNDLNLEEMGKGLNDLVNGERRAKLDMVPAAPTYLPDLERLHAAFAALPPELRGLPLATLLKETDHRRDVFLRLIHGLGELIQLCPTSPEDVREVAAKMVATFAPSRSAVSDPYAVSAAKAEKHAPEHDAMHAELAPIPTPDRRTADAWVGDFIAAGLETGRLLSSRADDLSGRTTRGAAAALRNEAVATLRELRPVVARAVKNNAELPRTLEADIFGLFDEMQRLAAGR